MCSGLFEGVILTTTNQLQPEVGGGYLRAQPSESTDSRLEIRHSLTSKTPIVMALLLFGNMLCFEKADILALSSIGPQSWLAEYGLVFQVPITPARGRKRLKTNPRG